VIFFAETLVHIQTTQRYIPDGSNFNNYHYENLKSYLLTKVSPSWEAANCAAIQEIPSNFKEPEGSSPCSQEPSNGPYPQPVRSSPYPPILSLRSILILPTHLRWGFKWKLDGSCESFVTVPQASAPLCLILQCLCILSHLNLHNLK
jgi:hypothetical protein